MPNFASILPQYTNADAEYIASAFRTGNFVSLSRVPGKLRLVLSP